MVIVYDLVLVSWSFSEQKTKYKLEKVFKKKHSCGFTFLQTVQYTNILKTYLNFKHEHLYLYMSSENTLSLYMVR